MSSFVNTHRTISEYSKYHSTKRHIYIYAQYKLIFQYYYTEFQLLRANNGERFKIK